MPKYRTDTGTQDFARQTAILLDRTTRTKHYTRKRVELLVVEICRLRAQMRDMNTENLLLWKALREAKS